MFDAFHSLLQGNYKRYRDILGVVISRDVPCIPINSLMLHDLAMIEEMENKTENGHVNYSKFLLLGKAFNTIRTFSKYRYTESEISSVQQILFYKSCLTEDQLYEKSNIILQKEESWDKQGGFLRRRSTRSIISIGKSFLSESTPALSQRALALIHFDEAGLDRTLGGDMTLSPKTERINRPPITLKSPVEEVDTKFARKSSSKFMRRSSIGVVWKRSLSYSSVPNIRNAALKKEEHDIPVTKKETTKRERNSSKHALSPKKGKLSKLGKSENLDESEKFEKDYIQKREGSVSAPNLIMGRKQKGVRRGSFWKKRKIKKNRFSQ